MTDWTPLWLWCESCGYSAMATHLVTFPTGHPFHVCERCASESVDLGAACERIST